MVHLHGRCWSNFPGSRTLLLVVPWQMGVGHGVGLQRKCGSAVHVQLSSHSGIAWRPAMPRVGSGEVRRPSNAPRAMRARLGCSEGRSWLNRKTRGLHVKCWYNTTAHTQSESPASWRCQRDGGGLSKLSTDGHTKGARAETHGGSSRCAQAAQHALRAACRAFAHTTQLRHNWPQLRHNWPKCPNVAYVRT